MAIYQDSQGFLWFGTADGLSRYDGYEFTVFRNVSGDSGSLGSNYVVAVGEDREKNLWAATWQGGLNRFNRKTENFTRFDRKNNLSDNSALSFLHDSQDRFWVGTIVGGLNLLNRSSGQSVAFKNAADDSASLSFNVIPCLLEDKRGNLWIGTGGGGLNRLVSLKIIKADSAIATFERYQHDPLNSQSLSHNAIVVMRLDPEDPDAIWIGTGDGGVCRMNTSNGTFTRHQASQEAKTINNNKIYSMMFDQRNQLWIGTFGGGISRLNPDNGHFEHYRYNPEAPFSLSDDKVISMLEDHSGNLWFGTHKAGLNKLSPQSNQFRHYTSHSSSPVQLNSNFITAVYEDSDRILWIGTESGLNRVDPKTGMVRTYQQDSKSSGFLSHNWVYAILEDENNHFWIGTYGGGFNRLDRSTSKFRQYRHNAENSESLSDDRVLTLARTPGELWVGTRGGGLNRLNSDGTMTRYLPNKDKSNSLSDVIVRDIYPDKTRLLWLATNAGLNQFDPQQNRFVNFTHDAEYPHSISDNRILCIEGAGPNHLWIGTMNGLNRLDMSSGQFERFFETDGLPGNIIYAIVADHQQQYWFSTNSGISRYDSTTASFINYDQIDGLINTEFNQGCGLRTADGRLFFGGNSGLDYFNPNQLAPNQVPPPIVITGFRLFNRQVPVSNAKERTPLKQAILQTEKLTLSHADRVFSFEFAALDYTAPVKNRYAYRMEGFDDTWIPANGRRFATYTNLDPGQYRFQVKASNNNDVWNEEGRSIDIYIAPPYWQTTWFRLLVLSAALGLLIAIYRIRVNSLLRVERTRTLIARDLHDDISATLSSINFFSQAIDLNTDNGINDEAKKYLGLIEESSRAAQEKIHDIIWTIDSDRDSWQDLLAKCRRFSAELLEAQKIEYQQAFPDDLPATALSMELRRNFWLIFKELINNIARHSGASLATINVNLNGRRIDLLVSDNGIGFDPAQASNRNGLKNIFARSTEVDAKAKLDSAPGTGTRWKISFPI